MRSPASSPAPEAMASWQGNNTLWQPCSVCLMRWERPLSWRAGNNQWSWKAAGRVDRDLVSGGTIGVPGLVEMRPHDGMPRCVLRTQLPVAPGGSVQLLLAEVRPRRPRKPRSQNRLVQLPLATGPSPKGKTSILRAVPRCRVGEDSQCQHSYST
jgi:hypothetical protein